MNKLKYIVSILVLGFVVYACQDDFLENNPQGALDGASLQAPAGIEASLISAYSMLDGWNGNWGNFGPWAIDAGHWVWGDVVSDDSYKGSDASDLAEFTEFELFQWRGSNGLLEDFFKSRYEGIARANATLALNSGSTEIDPTRQGEIEAEAKFLRAHYHFDMYKMFRNIPFYTEDDLDFRKANDADIAPMIIADMTDALNGLPNSFAEPGRATKGAAEAYLGKIKLYTGDKAGAKGHLANAINNYGYALAPCYHDNFNAATENGPESIFAVQFSVNDGDPGGNNGNYGTRLGYPHSGSPFGCCGFHQPTQNLVNAFKTDANGLPLLDNFNDADLDPVNDNVDPRLDWSVGRDDVPYYDHGLHNPSWIRDRAFAGPYSPKKQQFHAEHAAQYGSAAVAGAWGNQVSAINYNIIRLADVMLMWAEIEAETNPAGAMDMVNQIRTRANNCAQGPGTSGADIQVAPDDPSITWANYNVQPYPNTHPAYSNSAEAIKAVRHERRIELSNEGHRTYDLRRWGTLEATMNAYFDVEQTKRSYLANHNNVEAKHYAFPLPTVQIDLSEVDGTPMLKQNDGF